MLKWFNKKKKDNKGFTLVELIIVVAILAILVGLLAPQYTKYVEKSRKAADASNLENMVKAVEIAAADASQSIPAETYTIKISQKSDVSVTNTANTDATDVKDAITEFIGEGWDKTVLKSKKWNDFGSTDGAIQAEITVDKEGATSVKYIPENIKKLDVAKPTGTPVGP